MHVYEEHTLYEDAGCVKKIWILIKILVTGFEVSLINWLEDGKEKRK
jgi:hypothetical protein